MMDRTTETPIPNGPTAIPPTGGHGAFLLFLTVLTVAACGDGPASEAPAVTVRDSAGITIVSNPDPAGLPTFRPAAEPITRIGVLEGDPAQQLFGVNAGLVLDDGRVVLLDAGSSEVRWFDASGAFLGSQGRAGDGPGEYRRLSTIFPFGADSLAVWDASLRRLAVLHRDGSFGRTLTFPANLMSPAALGAFPDRTLLVLDQGFDRDAPTDGFQDLPGPVTTHTPRGEPTGDTLSVDRWITLHLIVTETTAEGRGRAFEIAPSRAVVPEGLWVGDPRRPELVLHARDGSGPVRIVRWPDVDRAVTDAHREAFLEARLASAPNEEVREALRRNADQQQFAAVLPAFGSVSADADARLWVRAYDPPGTAAPPRWWLFDAEGRALRSVELPEAAVLLWASGERVLIRLRDDLDVERVELVRLEPVPTPT